MPQPQIDHTAFGAITIDGKTVQHDVVITLAGSIRKRHKKLSKKVYGTSHTMSVAEARDIYESGCQTLIVGTGQNDMLEVSDEAEQFFADQNCQVQYAPTPEAIAMFNRSAGPKIGVFHITC